MSQDFRGDFLGFTFNGVHSSELGIVRINTGDRDSKDLSPAIKDTTVDIPGADGVYFIESTFQQRQFQITFAFDDVSESYIRKMRNLFGDKDVHSLVFDEEPYRVYSAKVTAPTKLNYICFDNNDETARVYKGEGNVTLTAFYPFAKAPFKTWTEYVDTTVGDRHYDINGVCIEEWVETSGLKEDLSGYDNFNVDAPETLLYNPGDVPSPISFVIQVIGSGLVQIKYTKSGNTKGIVIINTAALTTGYYYRFNSKTQLLEGGTLTGSIFTPNGLMHNDAIVAGDFFSIDPAPTSVEQKLVRTNMSLFNVGNIQYDYLYI